MMNGSVPCALQLLWSAPTLLARLGAESNGIDHDSAVDAALDELASGLESVVAVDRFLAIAQDAA